MKKIFAVLLAVFVSGAALAAETQDQIGEILQRARVAAAAVANSGSKFEVLRELASSQVALRDISAAKVTLRQALEIVMGISDENAWNEAMIEVAQLQAKAGDSEGALKTAGLVWREGYRDSAMSVIVAAQLETGRVQDAMKTAERNAGTRLAVSLTAQIAVAQAKKGDKTSGVRVLEHAVQLGASLQRPWEKSESLQYIAAAKAALGDIGGAVETINAIQEPTIKDIAWDSIAVAHATAGNMQAALGAAEHMQNARRKAFTLRDIGKIQSRRGDTQGALEIASGIQDRLAKAWLLRDVAGAQAAAKDIKTALKTVAAIQEDFIRAEALREIAAAQIKNGDMPGALQSVSAVPPDFKRMALRELAAAQAKLGDVKSALRTAGTIDDEQRSRVWAHRDIVVAQSIAGDVQGAFKTLGMIQDGEVDFVLSGSAARWIMAAQAKRGDVRQALEWADSQTSPVRKALAFIGVAEGIAERTGATRRQDYICRKGLASEWASPFIIC